MVRELVIRLIKLNANLTKLTIKPEDGTIVSFRPPYTFARLMESVVGLEEGSRAKPRSTKLTLVTVKQWNTGNDLKPAGNTVELTEENFTEQLSGYIARKDPAEVTMIVEAVEDNPSQTHEVGHTEVGASNHAYHFGVHDNYQNHCCHENQDSFYDLGHVASNRNIQSVHGVEQGDTYSVSSSSTSWVQAEDVDDAFAARGARGGLSLHGCGHHHHHQHHDHGHHGHGHRGHGHHGHGDHHGSGRHGRGRGGRGGRGRGRGRGGLHHHMPHHAAHHFHEFSHGHSLSGLKGRTRQAMARFVKHVSLEDNTVVIPGVQLQKIWKVRNDTDIPWPKESEIVYVGGEPMLGPNSPEAFSVGELLGGNEKNIAVDLVAPSKPGKYQSFWKLREKGGKKFGQRLWCQVIVRGDDDSSSTCSSSSSDSSSSSSSDDERSGKKSIRKQEKKIAKKNKKSLKKRNKRKRKHRKLQRKASKLRRKLERIERKLGKMDRDLNTSGSKANVPIAEEIVEATQTKVGELSIVSSKDSKADTRDSEALVHCRKQLLDMGFSPDNVDLVVAKHNASLSHCIEELTNRPQDEGSTPK